MNLQISHWYRTRFGFMGKIFCLLVMMLLPGGLVLAQEPTPTPTTVPTPTPTPATTATPLPTALQKAVSAELANEVTKARELSTEHGINSSSCRRISRWLQWAVLIFTSLVTIATALTGVQVTNTRLQDVAKDGNSNALNGPVKYVVIIGVLSALATICGGFAKQYDTDATLYQTAAETINKNVDSALTQSKAKDADQDQLVRNLERIIAANKYV